MSAVTNQVVESGHGDIIHDAQMDYYGKKLATCSSDRTIKIFSVTADQHSHVADLHGHEGPVWQVAWAHPKFGSLLASCSYDRKVIIWKETAENQWIQSLVYQEHDASVNSIDWAPHEVGLCLACGSSDGSISILVSRSDGGWDTSRISQAHLGGVTSVSWAPGSQPGLFTPDLSPHAPSLASGGCDNTVKVWTLDGSEWKLDQYSPLSKHSDWVRDVAWAPNLGLPKTTVASASQDGKVVIWTQAKEGSPWVGQELFDFKVPVWRVSWSLTGNLLAVSDGNNNVSLWKEVTDGQWDKIFVQA